MSLHRNEDGTYTRDGLSEKAKAHLLLRTVLPPIYFSNIGFTASPSHSVGDHFGGVLATHQSAISAAGSSQECSTIQKMVECCAKIDANHPTMIEVRNPEALRFFNGWQARREGKGYFGRLWLAITGRL